MTIVPSGETFEAAAAAAAAPVRVHCFLVVS